MQVVECRGGIGAGNLLKHHRAAGVCVDEVAEVVHLVVDDAPQILRRVVFGHRGACKGGVGHDGSCAAMGGNERVLEMLCRRVLDARPYCEEYGGEEGTEVKLGEAREMSFENHASVDGSSLHSLRRM